MSYFAIAILFVVMVILVDLVDVAADSHTPGIEEAKYKAANVRYHSMIATAYCINGTTASNTHTRPGICASKRKWFGKTARIYKNENGEPGELIGVYTVEDTGGRPIRNGSVIDIWLPTESECFQFGSKCVLVSIED